MLDITPCIFCKNEEYWIYYVLRDLMKVFDLVILMDTGSTDATLDIARSFPNWGSKLRIEECNYFNYPDMIGNSPNILRKLCPTEWMLLVGGDEIWREEELRKLQHTNELANMEVGMVLGRNVIQRDGKWGERDRFNADRLFSSEVNWMHTKYPFESHGLSERINRGVVKYLDAHYWHMRHMPRSSKDIVTYYRTKKFNYFPYNREPLDLPEDWLGEINPNIKNNYVAKPKTPA